MYKSKIKFFLNFFFRHWRIRMFLIVFEHCLRIFKKCSVPVRVRTFCGKCNSKIYALNFVKRYLHLHPDLNWCLSASGGNRSTSDAFSRSFEILRSLLLVHGNTQNFMHKILIISRLLYEVTLAQFVCTSTLRDTAKRFFL